MVRESFFRRYLLFLGLVFALSLTLHLTGVVYAVLQNHKLSGVNPLEGEVLYFTISPDGRYTVFVGDLIERGKYDLFSVTTTGGERVTLSDDLPSDCDVYRYFVSPNSEIVVFSAVTSTRETCGLFSIPIAGGTPIELHPRETGFVLRDINITFNNENVIYIVEQDIDPAQSTIYRVPIGGGDSDLLSYVCEGELDYQITPDSLHVVFRYYSTTGVSQLKRSTMDGAQEELLFSDNHISRFTVSPDGAYIIYLEKIGLWNELFSIPIGGGHPKGLNGELVAGGEVIDYKVAPNSEYVVYKADETTIDQNLLYQAPVDGSTTGTQLIPPVMVDPNENVSSFFISPNSQWVVYKGDFRENERFELFSISMTDGVNYPLTSLIIPNGDVGVYQITPNSLGVVFIADRLTDEVNELFGVFINGTGIRPLNDTLPDGGEVNCFKISPNSLGVIYCADQDEYGVSNLYAIPTLRTPGVMPLKVNPDLILGGDVVCAFEITPDNKGVIYIADQEDDHVMELFVTYDYYVAFIPMVVK
mgnify:CR=1 FL=1